jgi:phosphorylcholine metabolism protein LicD
MLTLHHTFVKDSKGKDIGVFLPMSDYQKILELIEDYEDVVAFDKAIKHKNEVVPFRDALIQLEKSKK